MSINRFARKAERTTSHMEVVESLMAVSMFEPALSSWRDPLAPGNNSQNNANAAVKHITPKSLLTDPGNYDVAFNSKSRLNEKNYYANRKSDKL